MGRGIGAASDYYRLRIIHVGDSDVVDLQWRDDILWRRPSASHTGETEVYVVQAVDLSDEDVGTPLASFDTPEDAHEALASAQEDLDVLTRSEFESRYFPADV